MLTQKEFVEGCLDYNRENGFVRVNDDEGYQLAHYPKPRCLGTETIPLTFNQHQIQGLLQSEEEEQVCFFMRDVKTFLDGEGFLCPNWFELYNLYDKWSYKNQSAGGMRTAELGVGAHAPGNAAKGGKKSNKPVRIIYPDGRGSIEVDSVTTAAKVLNLTRQTVSSNLHRENTQIRWEVNGKRQPSGIRLEWAVWE
jgi:hypothetical protein